MAVDLDAYFLRIGFSGERTPTLETLRTIHRLHPRAIPYENLNALMKWPVPLDAASVEQKLVRDGRGGYCYEQNLLFTHVLKALGFEIRLVSGRAVWRQSDDAPTARTHAVLHVPLDGQDYIADVGFGVATLTAPLSLEADEEQSTPHGPWIITQHGDRFDLQEQLLSDFELMNWYTATHPKSLFVNNLLIARSDDNCRYSLFNNTFTMRRLDGGTERHTLTSAAEMRRTLEDEFLLTLPDTDDLDEVLHRFATRSG
jgi:N-hydroxyarylamine O-acetyltransferase